MNNRTLQKLMALMVALVFVFTGVIPVFASEDIATDSVDILVEAEEVEI